MKTFVRQHEENIHGVLSGFDRLRFRGTLRSISFADGLFRYLNFLVSSQKPAHDRTGAVNAVRWQFCFMGVWATIYVVAGLAALTRIRSDNAGMVPPFTIRSRREAQKRTPHFRHVDFRLKNVSRQRRPVSLRVPALIFRFVAQSRKARSAVFVCKGRSGRSKTRSKSSFLPAILANAAFNSGQHVLSFTKASNCFRNGSACSSFCVRRYAVNSL